MRLRHSAVLFLPLSFCLAQTNDEEAKKALKADPRYQYSQAELYVAEENYAEAFRLYKLAADQELPEAQCGLGNLYRYGQGVAQDYKEAARLYRLAAEKGWPEAEFNL